jgi:hypothetical protein
LYQKMSADSLKAVAADWQTLQKLLRP